MMSTSGQKFKTSVFFFWVQTFLRRHATKEAEVEISYHRWTANSVGCYVCKDRLVKDQHGRTVFRCLCVNTKTRTKTTMAVTSRFDSSPGAKRNFCQAKFLNSHHVRMHRVIFFMPHALVKLIVRAYEFVFS